MSPHPNRPPSEPPPLPPEDVSAEGGVPPQAGVPPTETVSEGCILPPPGPLPETRISGPGAWAALTVVPTRPVVIPGYEVLGRLGEGGMGVVYKARHRALGRVVALKMILHAEHAGANARERFQREAEAVARLQHPNIVQVFEVGEHEGRPFFSLEFCAGGTLADQLDGTPWEAKRAARLVETLARAMHAAHQAQVIHRDLKPANVLLTAEGQPKITDFGLAKKLDEQDHTQPGAVLGTPSYMAPEQAGGKSGEIGPAADVYALGAILYELLVGRPPFKAATPLDTVLQVLADEPVPPRQLQSKCPTDLETIILKCLQKEPAKRYVRAEALAEDLRRFVAGEPIVARPVSRTERAAKWVKRNPVVAGLVAAVALVLLVGAVVSTWFGVDATRQADLAQRNARDAREKEKEAQKNAEDLAGANAELRDREAQLETTLARSLLRPLGLQEPQPGKPYPPLANAENEALWELAGNRSGRLGYRFVEEAARGLVTTRQLSHRAGHAFHAAVRLDGARRAEVEALLRERLEDSKLEWEQRVALAQTAAHEDCAPPTAAIAARILLEAMTSLLNQAITKAARNTDNSTDLSAAGPLADDLAAATARLEPNEAARCCSAAAALLTQAITKETTRETYRLHLHESLVLDLAAVAARLEPKDAGALLTWAMKKTISLDTRCRLAEDLAAVAARLEPREGARFCSEAAALLIQTQPPPQYAKSLVAVAARLEPKDAARFCGDAVAFVTQAMTRAPDANRASLGPLAETIALLAAWMEPREAARSCSDAATLLTRAMNRTPFSHELESLAKGLAAVASRMEPKEAAALLTQTLTRTTVPDVTRVPLAQSLAAVAARLEPNDAARFCGDAVSLLAQAMSQDPMAKSSGLELQAKALATVAARLEPKAAAVSCGKAVCLLTQALSDPSGDHLRGARAKALAAVAARLEPNEAGRACSEAVTLLTRAMSALDRGPFIHADYLMSHAEGLAAVAVWVDPKEAARSCSDAAALLTRAMSRTTDDGTLGSLAQGLTAVAPWMEPNAAAGLLNPSMTKTTKPLTLQILAQSLAAVAARLEPKEAARACSGAASLLTQAMTRTTDSYELELLAEGLAAVAARLEPKEAAQCCAEAAALLPQAMNRTSDPDKLAHLAKGLAVVTARLEPEAASRSCSVAATLLTQGMSRVSGLDFQVLHRSLGSVLLRVPREETVRHASAVGGAAGSVVGISPRFLLPALLRSALEPLPEPLPPQTLVDLLKQPVCVAEARRAVLDQLGRHYGRSFATHWDFVDFARRQKLALDLDSPPRRPAVEAARAGR